MLNPLRLLLSTLMMALPMLALNSHVYAAESATRASEFKLDNGLQVVVIPDYRAPVVTHMIWYRVGAADEVRGKSGIAHFLEHLMFKSTDKFRSASFPRLSGASVGKTTPSPAMTRPPTSSACRKTGCRR